MRRINRDTGRETHHVFCAMVEEEKVKGVKLAPYSPRIWAPLFHPRSHRSALAPAPVFALWNVKTGRTYFEVSKIGGPSNQSEHQSRRQLAMKRPPSHARL